VGFRLVSMLVKLLRSRDGRSLSHPAMFCFNDRRCRTRYPASLTPMPDAAIVGGLLSETAQLRTDCGRMPRRWNLRRACAR